MDLSALIFVALAVAWATYLIPKALRHHEDSAASRSVEGFSARIRVLARREPVDARSTRLVVEPGKPRSTAVPVPEPAPVPERVVPPAARRRAAARAARRRRRVLMTLVLLNVVVAAICGRGLVGYAWLVVPALALVAWLVACRLMVRRERAAVVPAGRLPVVTEPHDTGVHGPVTEEIVAVEAEIEVTATVAAPEPTRTPDPEAQPAPAGWDPVPVTLPTYVDKEPAARRSVRTIDLDSTGVWTSGRTAADAALAREADATRSNRTAQRKDEKERRASGS